MSKVSYVICSTQRSGSSMLCGLLRQTGVLGKPGETIVLRKLENLVLEKGESDLLRVAETVLSELASPNGVSGVKLHYHQFMELLNKEGFPSLFEGVNWIFIDRRDIVSQAVSLFKAWQTKKFSSKHNSKCAAIYDRCSIEKAGQRLVDEKSSWEWFFGRTGVAPLRLFYEDIIDSEKREVQKVCD